MPVSRQAAVKGNPEQEVIPCSNLSHHPEIYTQATADLGMKAEDPNLGCQLTYLNACYGLGFCQDRRGLLPGKDLSMARCGTGQESQQAQPCAWGLSDWVCSGPEDVGARGKKEGQTDFPKSLQNISHACFYPVPRDSVI